MYIPEHINYNGDPITPPIANVSLFYMLVLIVFIQGRHIADRERVMEMMNVPDRIVLTGGGGYQGYNAEPKLDVPTSYIGYQPQPVYRWHIHNSFAYLQIILNELPAHLTLADEVTYPDEPTVVRFIS